MSFPQSGQLDWVSLTSNAISVPINIMGRLALAGVDMYTIQVSKFYGAILAIPESYQRRVEQQLVSSQKFCVRNDLLYVGTGISTVPRELAKTSGGCAFAALVSCLRCCFQREYTGRVLHELIKMSCPESLKKDFILPSRSQFESLSE